VSNSLTYHADFCFLILSLLVFIVDHAILIRIRVIFKVLNGWLSK